MIKRQIGLFGHQFLVKFAAFLILFGLKERIGQTHAGGPAGGVEPDRGTGIGDSLRGFAVNLLHDG